MAEALISDLIEGLASMTLEGIKEELSLTKNIEKDVRKLKANLEAIQTVIEDAEKKQLAELGVKNWLEKLKDVSFDLDNVLDEWNTAILQSKIRTEVGEEDVRVDLSKKVCFSIPSPSSCFTTASNQFPLRRAIARKLKLLNERLDAIASEKDRHKLNMATLERPLDRPRTNSSTDHETEVRGRDEEKGHLLSLLLSENSTTCQDKEIRIIPILGMRGLGKTTLARLVYEDEKVKAHFEKRIWVCVSQHFTWRNVAEAIIAAAGGNVPNLRELTSLSQRIRKCIEGKRFLVVLDGVLRKEKYTWESSIKEPLGYGCVGSRVLVTTREEEVVEMMGARHSMIALGCLSEEHSWFVLKRLAFLERREDEFKRFKEIGREIARKCKGLPLVVRMVGSLMRFKKTENQWESVMNSGWWNFNSEDVEEIFAPLLLCYHDLSAKERRCFSYCSILRKDDPIQKQQLIEMWMSQNYVTSEDEGRECFETLATRSFFQTFEKSLSTEKFKMHDIVHDFAIFLTKKECITIEAKKAKPLDEKSRHLTYAVTPAVSTLIYSKKNQENLLSLFVVRSYYCSIDSSLFLHLTRLRSLTLASCNLRELPESIGKLTHLRYLDLRDNYLLCELPDSLCNLQTLNLLSCRALQRLPEGIGKLVSLRHLYLGYCPLSRGLPKGIARLKSLRRLDSLFVPDDEQVSFGIGDFKRLENLQLRGEHNCIKGCRNLKTANEAEQIGLKNNRDIVALSLSFGFLEKRDWNEDDDTILEGLEPHQSLMCLNIYSYMGKAVSPRWMMSLINLRELSLYSCHNCEVLPCLGKLPSLESVCIWHSMKSVRKVGPEFFGVTERDIESVLFPKLESLSFEGSSEWEIWEAITGLQEVGLITIMPCLKSLKFIRCPRLGALPDFLKTKTSLKELVISKCEVLNDLCRNQTGKEWDKISHIPNIQVDDKFVRRDGEWIQEEDVSEEYDDDPCDRSSASSPRR